MIRFLSWLRAILLSVLNGLAKVAMLVVLVFAVLLIISLARGDGLPGNMVLALDLREPIDDSAAAPGSIFTPRRVTVMDVVLGLDAAGRDARVKGVVMRLGNGALSTAEAHVLQGNGIHHQADIVLADANLFYCVSGDQLRELAFLLQRPARTERHRDDHALVGSLHARKSRMDEEFIVLVLTDDDETVIHRRIHGFMKSEIQGIRQGPLLFAPSLNPRHLFLDLDDGDIHASEHASPARADRWVRANVHVPQRPDWVFVKLFAHGISTPEDAESAVGEDFDEALTHLERAYNDGTHYVLHYITAREAYNLARAAAEGATGEPQQYLDAYIKPYRASTMTVASPSDNAHP